MTEDELAAIAVWLHKTQGVEMDAALLRDPAAAAAKLGTLVGAAARDLPFGAEPSGFDAALAKMAGHGSGQGRGGQGSDDQGGGDVG